MSKTNSSNQNLVNSDLINVPTPKPEGSKNNVYYLLKFFRKLFEITYIRAGETEQRKAIVDTFSFSMPSAGYPVVNFMLYDEGYNYTLQLGRYDSFTPTFTYGWCFRVMKKQ